MGDGCCGCSAVCNSHEVMPLCWVDCSYGGYGPGDYYMGDVGRFDIVNRVWTSVALCTQPRSGNQSCVHRCVAHSPCCCCCVMCACSALLFMRSWWAGSNQLNPAVNYPLTPTTPTVTTNGAGTGYNCIWVDGSGCKITGTVAAHSRHVRDFDRWRSSLSLSVSSLVCVGVIRSVQLYGESQVPRLSLQP